MEHTRGASERVHRKGGASQAAKPQITQLAVGTRMKRKVGKQVAIGVVVAWLCGENQQQPESGG